MSTIGFVEYRVRPVTRYVVTRFEASSKGGPGACPREVSGEHPNSEQAHAVAHALCRAEHERLGWPLGDERIVYPLKDETGFEIPKVGVLNLDFGRASLPESVNCALSGTGYRGFLAAAYVSRQQGRQEEAYKAGKDMATFDCEEWSEFISAVRQWLPVNQAGSPA